MNQGRRQRRGRTMLLALVAIAVVAPAQAGIGRTAAQAAGSAGTWSSAGEMGEARGPASATLLDGPACRSTQAPPPGYCGKLLVVGGGSAVSELYDPSARSWVRTAGTMKKPVGGSHTATLLDGPACREDFCGMVLVVSLGELRIPEVQLFDPAKGEWTERNSSNLARSAPFTATLLDGPPCRSSVPPMYCGDVLLAGGEDTGVTELYDVASDQWTVTGTGLNHPRREHTATLLDPSLCEVGSPPPEYPCGKVVVAGGVKMGVALDAVAVEVYDPALGTWTVTGELQHPRYVHSATLLEGPPCRTSSPPEHCGRVLWAGGLGGSGSFAGSRTAELYDPVDPARSRPTGGELVEPGGRGRHSAVLLDGPACQGAAPPDDCGLVLAAGGLTTRIQGGDPVLVGSAELYDPLTETWSGTGSMIAARRDHAAAMLAGPQCLGDEPPEWCGTAIVTGGSGEEPGTLRSAELFTASSSVQPPSVLRIAPDTGTTRGGTSVVIDGVALSAASGVSFGSTAAYGFEVESPTRIRATSPPGAAGLVAVTVTTPDGTSAEVNGARFTYVDGDAIPPEVTAVEPAAGTTAGGTRVTVRGSGFFSPGNPVTVVFGGYRAQEVTVKSDDRLIATSPPAAQGAVDVAVTTISGTSPASPAGRYFYGPGAWSPRSPLEQARYQHTSTLLADGRVLVAGGTTDFFSDAPLRSAALYDPATGRWARTNDMVTPRLDFTATRLEDGRVLVAGGRVADNSGTPSAELYDPRTGEWVATGAMGQGRISHSATLLDGPACRGPSRPVRCGKVLVAGGTAHESARLALASAELYDPVEATWAPVGDLATARTNHTATLLPDGEIIVAGGFTSSPLCPLFYMAVPFPLDIARGLVPTGGCGRVDVGTGPNPTPVGDQRVATIPAGDGQVVASTERYDPVTAKWRPAAPLAVARYSHSATLLQPPSCPSRCGVLVVGGVASFENGGSGAPVFLASAEMYDIERDVWEALANPGTARAGHTASLLPEGVLVAGRDAPFPPSPGYTTDSAELFDPTTGTWRPTSSLGTARGNHTATVLDGPSCRVELPPAYCGGVLAVGGSSRGGDGIGPPPLDSVELYQSAPTVTSVTPAIGSRRGGVRVEIVGTGFTRDSGVFFGPTPAISVEVFSGTRITAVNPPRAPGAVTVSVAGPGGTSETLAANPSARFRYLGKPGTAGGLAATALSESEIRLSFGAPLSSSEDLTSPPAARYVVKQAGTAIADDATFEAATSLCDGVCGFSPASPGQRLELTVGDLNPGTTYHYSIRALNEAGEPGDISEDVSVTTAGSVACRAVASLPGHVRYPGGRYVLLGLPDGTLASSASPLYGWRDAGAGGAYSVQAGSEAVRGGAGYWSWASCPRLLGPLGRGTSSVATGLGAYHAEMIGNPSGILPALVSGHDFGARWDPDLNGGIGGYVLSAYRQSFPLEVGEGSWVFAYEKAAILVAETGDAVRR